MNILVVDDDNSVRKGLYYTLIEAGYNVFQANNGLAALKKINESEIDLVITDIRMPKMDGMELIKEANKRFDNIIFMVITAHGTVELAVEAMKLGAADFLMKPFSLDEIEEKVERAVSITNVINNKNNIETSDIIIESEQMKEIKEVVDQIAETDSTVLITGPSGTGKEVVADMIHEKSLRKNKEFIKVNCAALNDNILESELFGHIKGAFTGAVSDRKGRFELANKGTIFLDEIGDISSKMQAQLLRIIQFGEFQKVGGVDTIKVDVRVIAATNKDLLDEIEKGNFREDLYYRLNVIEITISSLCERKEDIIPLSNMFIKNYSKKYNKNILEIEKEVEKVFLEYNWPGNIRELKNCIERACILCKGSIIKLENIKLRKLNNNSKRANIENLPEALEEKEKELIKKAYSKANGNKTKTAKMLGVTRTALLYKIKKYNI